MVDDENEAADFLERLDIDVSDLDSKSIFTERLHDIFLSEFNSPATGKQIRALFPLAQDKFLKFGKSGITRKEIRFRTGTQTRFILPNRRGLFNFKSALLFFRALR